MNTFLITSLLLVASCLVGHLGRAQQVLTTSLAPVIPVVVTPVLGLGVETHAKQADELALAAATLKQNRPVIPEPVYIINRRYLSNSNMLREIKTQHIAKIDIYKQGQGPVHWWSLMTLGIVNVTLKSKVRLKAKSLAAIKRELGLHGLIRFELNGAPIQDESLRIFTDAIASFDVTPAAPGTSEKTVVNIRLVPYQPKVYPPGSIRIRGLAQQ
jgi:hypothetical protein